MPAVPDSARCWAEIDLDAFRHNLAFVREQIGDGPGIIAVVKANAYGHGVERVVPTLRDGVAVFAVANCNEAVEVREVEPHRDILLLGPCLPAERREAVEAGFIVTVSSAEEAASFAAAASGHTVRASFKIDTGMGRIGAWHADAFAEFSRLAALPGVVIHSIATHLPVADEDIAFTENQIETFSELVAALRPLAPKAKMHVLNSAGVCRFPPSAFELVRVGLVLYGSASVPDFQPRLIPSLTWKTRVLLVRDVGPGRGISYGRTFITDRPIRAATLAVGYADGFPRQASGRGACVLVGGRRCPLLGRVTMDQIVVDVSAIEKVQPGDEAVLLGRQGAETILAAELAEKAGTIAWDIFTGIGGRTVRYYR
jgi:alanine racemase